MSHAFNVVLLLSPDSASRHTSTDRIAWCPDLDLVTSGDNSEHAIGMAADAIRMVCEDDLTSSEWRMPTEREYADARGNGCLARHRARHPKRVEHPLRRGREHDLGDDHPVVLAYRARDRERPLLGSADLITKVLNGRKWRGEKIYTGAYMIPAPHDKGADKQAYIAEQMVGDLWRRTRQQGDEHDPPWFPGIQRYPVFPRIHPGNRPWLQDTHRWIMQTKGWGQFLAYQAVVDMRFTRVQQDAGDVSTWAAAGPGTVRGLNRIYGRPTDAALDQRQALEEMRAIYQVARGETGVEMDFSDVPNVLCETDKYLRVQRGEGKPRARYVHGRGA